VYEDTNDARYVHPRLLQNVDPYSFHTGGTNNQRFRRDTKTWLGKFDLTGQATRTHQVKGGIEFRRHRVFFEDITVRPSLEQTDIDLAWDSPYIDPRILDVSTTYHSTYTHHPIEFSAYIQDKMEFKNFIVNLGVRVDYFDPDGVVLADESDPSIYNPIRPENRYHDDNKNGVQDEGEPDVTLEEREAYWYKDAGSKINVSPRFGAAFPFMEGGVIHFSYGHFFQIPRFERLYQNPDFELELGTGNQGVIGNADLKPEKTVSGEIGLQQQLTDDLALEVTAYFRDIRDLAGTRADEITIFGGSAKYSKIVNSDFGFVRGIVLALSRRFVGGYAVSLDYTYQIAKASNSDPEAARNALAGGALPEVQLTPLEWDQTHTVNATFSYAGPDWGFSLIGQYGSGMPYTPRRSEDITALLTNSQKKPFFLNADVRAYKDFNLGPSKVALFLRVYNIFDRLNEVNVYDDTGRGGFTTDQQRVENTNPVQLVNTVEDWFTNMTHFSEPRRIELGVTYSF
ncbi:MAG: TonB-dependent receptor domain-containing protein, partial [bacterium]